MTSEVESGEEENLQETKSKGRRLAGLEVGRQVGKTAGRHDSRAA